jgi:glycosyltransferase involved in cell wall biosynthesis
VKKLKIVLIHRKPHEGRNSIEELFSTIAGQLRSHTEVIDYKLGSRWYIFIDLWNVSKFNADIYHVVGDVHYFIMFLFGKKSVLTIHDINHYLHDLTGLKSWIYKWIWIIWPIYFASSVTVISKETKANIIKNFGWRLGALADQIHVIENCYNHDFKLYQRPFNKLYPSILHIGTSPNKNIPRLIEALRGIKCQLIIIGKLDNSLKEKLVECNIDYVNFSNLTYKEICQRYMDCDIVSFTSIAEGFGMPIIESQASGRPIITSNLSPMREIAGEGACLVDPFDVKQIRDGILKIITNSVYRNHIVKQGLENVVRFSPSKTSGKYLELYKQLLD